MRHVVNKIVATAEPQGKLEAVERLVKQVDEMQAEAVVILGSLAPRDTVRAYVRLFKTLASRSAWHLCSRSRLCCLHRHGGNGNR